MVDSNKNIKTSNPYSHQLRSIFRIPAVQALLIQCGMLPVSLILAGAFFFLTGWHIGIGKVALLHGAIAALVANWCGLALWWLAIQLLFPYALITIHSLELPPWIFLAGFIFLLSFYWTSFRTQVPFYPSNQKVWEAVIALLPQDTSIRVVDIGSGTGSGLMYMAARQPKNVFVGIEVAPLPWLISTIKGWVKNSPVRFVRGDYGDLDLGGYDVVFAYLSPAAMPALWRKAQREMCSGSLLLSYEFLIPGVAPSVVLRPSENSAALYAWYI